MYGLCRHSGQFLCASAPAAGALGNSSALPGLRPDRTRGARCYVADALVALPLEAQCVCMPRAKISWRRKCVSKHKCGRRVAEGYSEAGVGLSRKAAGHQGSQLGEICDPQTPHGSHRGITGSRQSRKAGSAPSCEQGRIRCTSGGNVSAPGRHPAAEIGKQLASLTQWRADNRGCVCASSWKSRGGFVERQGDRTAGPKEDN